jgi:hypothetical protein
MCIRGRRRKAVETGEEEKSPRSCDRGHEGRKAIWWAVVLCGRRRKAVEIGEREESTVLRPRPRAKYASVCLWPLPQGGGSWIGETSTVLRPR